MDQHEARSHALEEELSEANARAEAAELNAELAGQRMEERYRALAEERASQAAAKKKLELELETACKEIAEAKQAGVKHQMELMERDKAMQQHTSEMQNVGQQLRALDRKCGHQYSEIVDLQTQLHAAQDRRLDLMSKHAQLETQVFEAKSREARATAAQAQAEHEVADMKAHVQRLIDQLDSHRESLQAEKASSSSQMADLSQKLRESQEELHSTKELHASLRGRVDHYAKKIEDLEFLVKEEKESSALTQETLQGQLDQEQKMAAMHKRIAGENSRKVAELGGIVQQFREHLQASAGKYKDALSKEQGEREELNRQLEQERANKQRILAEFQSGNGSSLPVLTNDPSTANGAHEDRVTGPDGGFSITELVKKNADLRDKLRVERSKNAQLDLDMEQASNILDSRSALLEQQRIEREEAQENFACQMVQLKEAIDEKRELQQRMALLRREAKNAEKAARTREQQLQDVGHQLQAVLDENQHLRHNRPIRAPPAAPATMDSSDVINHRLLLFKDIKELQANNIALLSAVRQLSDEQDRTREEVRAEVQAEKEAHLEELRAALNNMRQLRESEGALIPTLVRQRDTYRDLIVHADDPQSLLASARQLGLLPEAAYAARTDTPPEAPQVPNISERMRQEASELEQVRRDARENEGLMQKEVSEAKADAYRASAEAARSRAQAEFESHRCVQLEEQMTEREQHLSTVIKQNSRQQELLASGQIKQSEAAAAAEAARSRAEVLQEQLRMAEAELHQLRLSSTRDAASLEEANRQRLDATAKLKASEIMKQERELEVAKQQKRSADQCTTLQKEVDELHTQVTAARYSNKSAQDTLEAACADAQSRLKDLEQECKQARDARSSAEQRAAAADARVDMLSKAVQKAESRATLLEQRAQTISSGQAGEASHAADDRHMSGSEMLQQLRYRVKQLEEQLATAQESVAGATSTSKQFQSIAESNEAAMAKLQAQHSEFRQTAEAQQESYQASLKDLQTQLQSSENQQNAAREAQREADHSSQQLVNQAMTDMAHHRDNAVNLAKDKQQLAANNDNLRKQINVLRHQLQEAQGNFEREVIEHSNSIKRLNTLKGDHNKLEAAKQGRDTELAEASSAKARAEQQLQETLAQKQAEASKLQDQMRDLKAQNHRLHEELERAAGQSVTAASDAAGDDRLGVINYLREQVEVADARLALTDAELKRWQQQTAVAERNVRQLQAQLDVLRQQSSQTPQLASQQEALVQAQNQIRLLSDANNNLRSTAGEHEEQLARVRSQLGVAQAALKPLDQRVRELEAAEGSHQAELERAYADTKRWHERVTQLTTRHKSVDKEEHDRVGKLLQDARADLATAKTEAEQAAQAQLETITGLQSQLEQAQKTISQVRAETAASGDARLRQDKAQFKKNMSEALKQKQQMKQQLDNSNTQITQLQQQLDNSNTQITQLQQKLQDGIREVEEHKQAAAASSQTLETFKTVLKSATSKIQELKLKNDILLTSERELKGKLEAACQTHPDLDDKPESAQAQEQPRPAAAALADQEAAAAVPLLPVASSAQEQDQVQPPRSEAEADGTQSSEAPRIPSGSLPDPPLTYGSQPRSSAQPDSKLLEEMRAKALGSAQQVEPTVSPVHADAAAAFLDELASQPELAISQPEDASPAALPASEMIETALEERGAGKRTGDFLEMPDERDAKRSRSQLDVNAPAFLPPVVSLPTPAAGPRSPGEAGQADEAQLDSSIQQQLLQTAEDTLQQSKMEAAVDEFMNAAVDSQLPAAVDTDSQLEEGEDIAMAAGMDENTQEDASKDMMMPVMPSPANAGHINAEDDGLGPLPAVEVEEGDGLPASPVNASNTSAAQSNPAAAEPAEQSTVQQERAQGRKPIVWNPPPRP
ncbi:hypothetical protein WJX74_007929 [Apatococcus lobatus]|uniref:Nucleoprotein TPR n=1 Tax=Apatococcus lobatus TaxID=904363 RepID=A0AAW1RI17_9CHLO